jgi:membrane fusion protein, copper/silver efflux system
MKKLFLAMLWLSLAAFVPAWAQTGSPPPAAAGKTYYTCGMHPQVIQDYPGDCPICGMKLTPILKSAGNAGIITVDPATVQNMNFRTEPVTRGELRRTLRTFGSIAFDETRLTDVTARFKGQIESLAADTTGQLVHRGDPLYDIYSSDLYDAQVDYLTSTWLKPSALTVTDSPKTNALIKLKYYGFSDEQIAALKETRKPQRTVTVRSPADGFIIEKNAVQGQAVDEGMKLYRIADLSLVWVQAQIYEQDLPFVQLGQPAGVSLSYMPDRKFRGLVTYIYPTVDEKTRTAQVRMEFHNPGFLLKPGMFATVELDASLADNALLVPGSAVLRSGEKNTVFVALDGGKFEPRTVILGPRGENDTYQVLGGLNEGERVVTSGQFMLDSESQLREAIQKMMNPNAPAPAPTVMAPVPANPAAAPAGTNFVYVCPMPEHFSITYDHPGKCPLCGMTLVPVSPQALAKLQPASSPATNSPADFPKLYTCPMAVHADVVTDHPGKCPKCGMELVPTTAVAHGKIAEENWRKQHQN